MLRPLDGDQGKLYDALDGALRLLRCRDADIDVKVCP